MANFEGTVDEKSELDEERQPLLGEEVKKTYSDKSDASRDNGNSSKAGDVDEMAYQPQSLLSWFSVLRMHGTIWTSGSLWLAMAKLCCLFILVTAVVIVAVPDPVSLKIENFIKLSYFLNFFVGLLSGFFMTSSLNRWHDCAQGFLELGDAIRNLLMQFQALGVAKERSDLCMRYGLLSGWFLKQQLSEEALPAEYSQDSRRAMWKALAAQPGQLELGSKPLLDEQELDVLKKVSDPSGVMWTWITSLVARMAQDGEIPGMATPTYGRIMNIAQDAHDGIRHVRSSISVRAPFVYVHMLASLVHINNIMNAVCFGLCMGIAISGHLIQSGYHYYTPKVRGNQVERDTSFTLVTAFVCCIGPLLYQAITEISVALSQPFGTNYGRLPIDRMLFSLEEDLLDGKVLAASPPHWEPPHFQQK